MNRRVFALLPLCLLGLFVSSSFSQKQDITEAKFNELIEQAKVKLTQVSYREKESTTGYDVGTSAEYIREHLPPDRSRALSVQKTATGTTRTEVIWIGNVKYLKLNEEDWKKEEPKPSTGTSGSGSGSGSGTAPSKPDIKQRYEYLGTEKLNGIVTEHYQMTRTITFNLSNGPYVRKNSRSCWYNKDGMLIKMLFEDRMGNRTYRVVTEYAYDVNLKIEAPEIKSR